MSDEAPAENSIASMGGKAAAANMTKEQRKARAKKAAESRWGNVFKATHTGELKIGELTIPCAVLEDGTRVLTQYGFLIAIGRSGKPAKGRGSQFEEVAPFLAVNNLKPFVDQALADSTKPMMIQVATGSRAYAFKAELLPKVCEVYLRARDAGDLLKSQEGMAKACEILMRGLAHVGIIALVDEATGFQKDRARDALAKILEAFIAKELQPYARAFSADFYEELFRLKNLKFDGTSKRPQYIGHLTNNLVYSRLAPGILAELKAKNPVVEKGRRKHHHHRHLTKDVGHPGLKEHIKAVATLMKAADDWGQFTKMIDRSLPVYRGPTLFDSLDG